MKALKWILAVYWGIMFISLFFGYEPDKLVIGCSFLLSALMMIPEEKY